MANVHVVCFFASYLVALALEGARLRCRNAILRALSLAFTFAGLLAHSLYLVKRSNQADLPPLLSSTHDWLLVLGWTAVVFYVVLAVVLALLLRDSPIGLFLLPAVLILIGASDFVAAAPSAALSAATNGTARDAHQTALRNWGMFHASFLVFAIAVVIVGFIFSIWYLVQHRRLKHRQAVPTGLALPSLATLANLIWWSVVISIPLLTLGLLTGVPLIFLSRRTPGPIAFSDPLVVGSALAGVVMLVFFAWLLRANHVGGKQLASRTLWAFGLLLITLIGLQVLLGGHTSTRRTAAATMLRTSEPAAMEIVAR